MAKIVGESNKVVPKFFSIGQLFSVKDGDEYQGIHLLVQVRPFEVSLVCLQNGNRLADPIRVNKVSAITPAELNQAAGSWDAALYTGEVTLTNEA